MADVLLEVTDLHAYYGGAPILQGVGLDVRTEPVAIVGRNGMGKTTLCQALMGMLAHVTGSAKFRDHSLLGRKPHQIAALGIGYVPQGRRIFPSLTTDEHLHMVRHKPGNTWTPDAIYELFPSLAQRRKIGAGLLSGGEQQMLAIGRALITDPRLLILDEPSEGLAPTIVEVVARTLRELSNEGVGILLVEQNVWLATELCERVLIMMNGKITDAVDASLLSSDAHAQRRYLGVEASAT